jgi:hypothetical protein
MAKLLDLSKLFDRSTVRINGTDFPLKTNGELPPLTTNRLSDQGMRVEELTRKRKLTKAESDELATLAREMCAAVLVAPTKVIAKLSHEQHWAVCQAFLFQTNPSLAGMVATDLVQAAPGATSTGAS